MFGLADYSCCSTLVVHCHLKPPQMLQVQITECFLLQELGKPSQALGQGQGAIVSWECHSRLHPTSLDVAHEHGFPASAAVSKSGASAQNLSSFLAIQGKRLFEENNEVRDLISGSFQCLYQYVMGLCDQDTDSTVLSVSCITSPWCMFFINHWTSPLSA